MGGRLLFGWRKELCEVCAGKNQEEFTVRRIANHFLQHQRDYIKKEYRFVTGKISWLAKSTRPDLNYTAFQMSKKNTNTTIADLQDTNRVLKKV